jgi:hypothetical protein
LQPVPLQSHPPLSPVFPSGFMLIGALWRWLREGVT